MYNLTCNVECVNVVPKVLFKKKNEEINEFIQCYVLSTIKQSNNTKLNPFRNPFFVIHNLHTQDLSHMIFSSNIWASWQFKLLN